MIGIYWNRCYVYPLGEEEFEVDNWGVELPLDDHYEIDSSGGERYDWWLNTLEEWSDAHEEEVEDWSAAFNSLTNIYGHFRSGRARSYSYKEV